MIQFNEVFMRTTLLLRVKRENVVDEQLRSHYDAVRHIVLSAFPSADVVFINPAFGNAMLDAGDDNGFMTQLRQMAYGSNRASALPVRRGPFSGCCSPREVAAWRSLYTKSPPQRPLREDAADPCWTPHAVVYVGGFESPDLHRVAAPKLFAEIPLLISDRERHITAGGRTFEGAPYKIPKFATKTLHKETLLQGKGCAVHEPDLLELAVPHAVGQTERRTRTLLSFAGLEATVEALHRIEEPAKRGALRPAFGYSAAALRCALPAAVVKAARLLRQWNSLWAPVPLSAAFWLSAVGHYVGSDAASRSVNSGTTGEENIDLLTKELALSTASLVNEKPESCCVNYFLPVEELNQERGVKELLSIGPRLPVGRMHEVFVNSFMESGTD
ncbi:unnamed protein product [Trypanosoma congolense IL3000]|uniref:WGS project CAEQ00000000 data, annotated contig 2060 n=1 Tax=Trypanosoma congolense (strain IL3000) TaxID=1068625 RepID=F9WB47_TRYCI|nr:unnamed protein product [Trypanosoma congolense IL3000]